MNARSILSALLPLGAMLALTACIEPVIIGGNGNGGGGNGGGGNGGSGGVGVPCMTDSDCGPNLLCVNGMCGNGDPATCNGVPSPLSCTQTGCAAGQLCVPDPDPSHCYPSACGCDPMNGGWVCTADCGQGSYCVTQQCGMDGSCPPGSMCDATGNCVPACTPSPEVCNGLDDDCDAVIDEQDDPSVALCADGSMCVMGQCQGGNNPPCMSDADCPSPNQICLNGVCSGGMGCTTETCNGIDDDCNGVVDDGAGAICADGTMCVNGGCGGNPQQCGPNSPPCPAGQVCTAMGVCVPGGCMGGTPEVCNGLDDDCDGVIDDAVPGTTLCANGGTCVNGMCTNGNPQQCSPNIPCPAGQVCNAMGVCVPGACQPAPEVCNGLDDDCDGVVDDAVPGTTLCTNGICFAGSCKIACMSNANCPAGASCVNGICL